MDMVLAYRFVAALLPRIMVISGWMMRSEKKAVVSDLLFLFINQKRGCFTPSFFDLNFTNLHLQTR